MSLSSSGRVRLAMASLFAFASLADAAVLSLSPSGTTSVVVRNVLTQGDSMASVATCCGSNSGTLAAAPALDRVYFVTGSSGNQVLQTLSYGIAASPAPLPLPAAYRVTHAQYDPTLARIISVALATADQSPSINAITPASAATTVLKPLATAGVAFRSGVIAYSAAANRVYLAGRASGAVDDGLLRFDLGSAASPLAPVVFSLPGETVLALALHPNTGVLYGLSRTASSNQTRLLRFDFAPAFAAVPLGVGITDCCAVMVGSVAIDTTSNALYASTRLGTGSDGARLRRFDLVSGAVTTVGPVISAGLFEDTSAPNFDRIFANGFD